MAKPSSILTNTAQSLRGSCTEMAVGTQEKSKKGKKIKLTLDSQIMKSLEGQWDKAQLNKSFKAQMMRVFD